MTQPTDHYTGFRGHAQRDVPREDAELTHVGPGTPCGELMRRHWQPVCMSEELGDLPVPLRILGEDLVVFRDGRGSIGLMHRHCAHRGVSLEFGIVMPRGIKCCYHGWHYDIDGSILELPSEPAGSPIKGRVFQGAYPTHEHDGLVFAYLGPLDRKPPFPLFDTTVDDVTESVPFSLETPCNWLQVYENTQDPVHVLHLHARSSGVQFGEASGVDQVIEYRETPLGMMNVQTRRVGGHLWVRTVDCILPNMNQTGAIWEEADRPVYLLRTSMTRWMVPIDDTHTVCLGWRHFSDALDPRGQGERAVVGKGSIDFIGQTGERPYEEQQRQPGDYEAQVSQRPIAVHALEHRATSDRGVVMLRRLVRQAIRAVDTPDAIALPCDGPIGTFTQDTVHPFPAPDALDDEQVLRAFGAHVADNLLEHWRLPEQQRREQIRSLCEQYDR